MRLSVGDKALLLSEPVKANLDYFVCFKFYYHAFGTSVANLRVNQSHPFFINSNQVWDLNSGGTRSADRSDWQQAQILLKISENFVMQIEGEVGEVGEGDLR